MELLKYCKYTMSYDTRKCIDLLGIGNASQGAFNFLSSIFTNATNKKIAEKNNELAYKMFNEGNEFNRAEREAAQGYNTAERLAAQQYNTSERLAAQDYNTQMWLKQAAYNSPAQQAERLRVAGMNPANIIDNGGSVGSVQSSPASVSPASVSGASAEGIPALATPHLEAPQLSAVDDILRAMSVHEDIKGKSIDNEMRSVRNKAEIDKLIAEKQKTLEDKNLTTEQRYKLRYEIESLRIANARNEFAMRHDQIVEDRTARMFDKQMRQMDDAHDESSLRQSTQRLVNFLNVRKDMRDERTLSSALAVARAQIQKMAAEKGFIDKQAASEIIRKQLLESQKKTEDAKERLTSNQADMADTDRRNKNFDYQRKVDSFADMLRSDNEKHLDHFIYYIGEAVGVPVKGLFK